MNFVSFSPHFPANFQAFCVQLQALGATVLGLADAPYEQLHPQLQNALHDYYQVGDLHNYDELLRALGHFTSRHGKIDRLDSHAEYWLETEARLRTDFNIWGIHNDFIQSIKRKSFMKNFFHKAGVPAARGAVCETLAEALALVEEVGFPLVAKPDIGVGAASTYKLHDLQALRDFFERKPPEDYILEEFIAGDIYTFDGLTDHDGNLLFYTSLRYDKGVMEAVQANDHIYYYSLREIPADLEAAGRKILETFNVRERFFHFEFFRRHADGQIVALEVNIRPPGGLTTDMFNFGNDFDIYREWANVLVHNRFEASWSRPYHVIYVSRKHHLPYRHAHEEVLKRYQPLLCHHESMPAVFSTALGNHGYIARSPERDELLDMARFVQALTP